MIKKQFVNGFCSPSFQFPEYFQLREQLFFLHFRIQLLEEGWH